MHAVTILVFNEFEANLKGMIIDDCRDEKHSRGVAALLSLVEAEYVIIYYSQAPSWYNVNGIIKKDAVIRSMMH